jgi:hypothetical protein
MPEAAALPPPPIFTPPVRNGVDMFSGYNPQGAMGGLAAPAYIAGFAPSEKAVAAWQGENRGITSAMVDQLRMPMDWFGPEPETQERGPYGGGRIGTHLRFGDQRGSVDPNALRAASMGGKYDIGARRDAIATQLAQNQYKQNLFNQAGGFRPGPPRVLDPLDPEQAAARVEYDKLAGIG